MARQEFVRPARHPLLLYDLPAGRPLLLYDLPVLAPPGQGHLRVSSGGYGLAATRGMQGVVAGPHMVGCLWFCRVWGPPLGVATSATRSPRRLAGVDDL